VLALSWHLAVLYHTVRHLAYNSSIFEGMRLSHPSINYNESLSTLCCFPFGMCVLARRSVSNKRGHASSAYRWNIPNIQVKRSFLYPRTLHYSLTCNIRSECDTYIRASVQSFALIFCCAFTGDLFTAQSPPRSSCLIISSSFFLLRVRVISPRVASTPRRTGEKLKTTVSKK